MEQIVRLVGPNQSVELLGVRLVGVNADNGKKVLFTLVFIVAILLLAWLLRRITRLLLHGSKSPRLEFWIRQGIKLMTAVLLVVGVASIWFDDPTRLTTALGLVTAGLAFALQRVVTAVAGYFVILRGKMFNVGDRITIGGVRGDVIALDFTQTTLMEMGQPPPVQNAEPAMWVKSRQYTGRVVSVTNAKIFDEPVYNYTRDFPFLWEEIAIPISYDSDRSKVEKILLEVAKKNTIPISSLGDEALAEMQRRYFMRSAEMSPKVFFRLTDNWLELTVRFLVEDHGIREVKDVMAREILSAMEAEGIGLASATFEIVGLPPLRLESTEDLRSYTNVQASRRPHPNT